ncbi:hypothetical protein [Telluribacter humicola]|uniref:hypothetical protein n=1 Tax=Telluribacter humicola TaxID=1720261 RepID=UPI001A96FAF1|nr:hypothetical protein [Telluribacter humicola]
MEQLLFEYQAPEPDAKVLVLFGGSPVRRDGVIRSLRRIGSVSIYGTLSQEEGLRKVEELGNVDLVLIGGRYTQEQRLRIREYLRDHWPTVQVTEPGLDYPYDDTIIAERIKELLYRQE